MTIAGLRPRQWWRKPAKFAASSKVSVILSVRRIQPAAAQDPSSPRLSQDDGEIGWQEALLPVFARGG